MTAGAIAVVVACLVSTLAPALGATTTFGNGDTRATISGTVASTQLQYSCGTPTPRTDPACNNYPLRFELTEDFSTIYIGLTVNPLAAPDLDLYLYQADGTLLGSSASTGSAERAVIRLDRPLTTDAVLVVQPFTALQGTPFTLDLRVKTSSAVPPPVTTS